MYFSPPIGKRHAICLFYKCILQFLRGNNMKLKIIASSLAMLTCASMSGQAAADTVYNIGVLPPIYINNATVQGEFTDTYAFNIPLVSYASASATNNPLSLYTYEILNIPNLTMYIYDGSYSLLSTASSGQSISAPIAPGNYYALVHGTTSGLGGGNYTIAMTSTPAPVPVPAAAWLLGSGLLGLAGIARRKEVA